MTRVAGSHERLQAREEVVGPSDRSFGLTVGTILAILGTLPLLRGGSPIDWLVVVGGLLLLLGAVRPGLLRPLNRMWLWLGTILHQVVNPVISAVIFYGVLTPVGVIRRLLGDPDIQRTFRDETRSTYWIERDDVESGPATTMTRQF